MKARTKRLTLGSALILTGVLSIVAAFTPNRGILLILFFLSCISLIVAGGVAMQKPEGT